MQSTIADLEKLVSQTIPKDQIFGVGDMDSLACNDEQDVNVATHNLQDENGNNPTIQNNPDVESSMDIHDVNQTCEEEHEELGLTRGQEQYMHQSLDENKQFHNNMITALGEIAQNINQMTTIWMSTKHAPHTPPYIHSSPLSIASAQFSPQPSTSHGSPYPFSSVHSNILASQNTASSQTEVTFSPPLSPIVPGSPQIPSASSNVAENVPTISPPKKKKIIPITRTLRSGRKMQMAIVPKVNLIKTRECNSKK
ncbi:hypothetical protein GDO81_017179 [Engystomops pustulosus]|uniref:Uncharacterized protein n=1 Tax=Engystomops pustulosus TaxID=76066 RepID=A0AAV7ADK8_ENGPU|nr:hypothetical protein GDO81_017179 [Engystomops pustulosus]